MGCLEIKATEARKYMALTGRGSGLSFPAVLLRAFEEHCPGRLCFGKRLGQCEGQVRAAEVAAGREVADYSTSPRVR